MPLAAVQQEAWRDSERRPLAVAAANEETGLVELEQDFFAPEDSTHF